MGMGDPVPRLDPATIADLLEATAVTVTAEVHALGQAGATWPPAPGEWCANAVVGHLLEADRRGFAGRIRIILAEDEPVLVDWDQPAVAAARDDCAKDLETILDEFLPYRLEAAALMRTLGPAELARVGVHPRVGRLSAAGVAAEWVHHDRNHVRQLLEVGQAIAWQAMGAARKFTDPKA